MVSKADYRALYPFTSHWFDCAGQRLHYLDEGPREAPALVLLHGNPTWSFYYRTLIPALSQTHRVIAPDHIGCGYSDKPQDYPYTLEQHIRNLEALLAHLDVAPVTLLVHDWGGGIGMGYATRHPEAIERLVIFNTAAFFLPNLYWGIHLARLPVLGDLLLRGLNAFAWIALLAGTSQRRRFTPAVRAGYLAPYGNWHDRVAILRFVQDIPMERDHPTRQTIGEIEARLPLLVDKPLLICWGADDPVFTVKDFLAGWRERFPAAEVHVLERAGHYVVEDAHERILPLVQRFLENS
ncbi:MAG TPA: alpha/beta fold hydrolase [Chloroflexi bacterium]|nr:alpha/beta fold hydrolase [Chloroflexota bacterium]